MVGKRMSNQELLDYMAKNHHGKSLKEITDSGDKKMYERCYKRGIIPDLLARGVIVKLYEDDGHWDNWENFEKALRKAIEKIGHFPTHEELIKKKFSMLALKIRHFGGANEVRKRMGHAPGARPPNYFKNMSDENLIHYVRSWHYEDTLKEFRKDSGAYAHCLNRGILDSLIDEGTLIREQRAAGSIQKMSDEEIKNYIRQHHKGKLISKLRNSADAKIYEEAIKRGGIIDSLVKEGVLTRKKERNGFWSENPGRLFDFGEQFLRDHPEYKVLPTYERLKELGYGPPAKAIQREYGISKFREILAERTGQKPLSEREVLENMLDEYTGGKK